MSIERYLLYKKSANGTYSQVKPKQEREGRILFDNDPDADNPHMYKPVVCVKYRNNWCWRDIDDLPASKWNTYKTNITTNMENLLRKLRTESNSHNVTKKKLKSTINIQSDMFIFMWNKMSKYDREEFLKLYPNQHSSIESHTCKVCSNMTATFTKCRHSDCTGMCTKCHSDWNSGSAVNEDGIFVFGHLTSCGTNCPSCKQSQLYTCPICYDEFDENKIVKSDNCDHFVCQSCFCNSFNSNPIVDCPMCRSQFKNTLGKTSYEDGFPEEPIVV